jgi:hypothetical protein
MEQSNILANRSLTRRDMLGMVFALVIGVSVWAIYFGTRDMLSQPKTEAEVRTFLVGSWVYTDPIDPNKPPYEWQRIVFDKEVLSVQSSSPSATRWGNPVVFKYTVERKKTLRDGIWYWHIRGVDSSISIGLFDGASKLQTSIGMDGDFIMRRGDKDLSR